MEKMYNKYIQIIKQICGYDVSVKNPIFLGEMHPVFLAKTQDSKTVFRFSSKSCALRNAEVSKVLTRHGFNVPAIEIKKFGSQYCEIYPLIEGLTLAERATQGISKEKLDRIYKQIIEISYGLAAIPLNEIKSPYNTNIIWQEKVANLCYNIINFSPRKICHTDLHDKNILLDNQDNICAILDLDAINKGSFVLSVIKMMDYAQSCGYDIYDLTRLCPNLNKNTTISISRQIDMYKRLRNLYWLTTGQHQKKHTLQK